MKADSPGSAPPHREVSRRSASRNHSHSTEHNYSSMQERRAPRIEKCRRGNNSPASNSANDKVHDALQEANDTEGKTDVHSHERARSMDEEEEEKEERPNLKAMNNSERGKYYRRKRKLYVQRLERSVARLQEQVRQLELEWYQKQRVNAGRGCLDQRHHRLVQQYYEYFGHGLPVSLRSHMQDHTQMRRVATPSDEQISFIRELMEENVRVGDAVGVDVILQQWARYTEYHSFVWMEPTSIELLPVLDTTPIFHVRASIHVQWNEDTVEALFPSMGADLRAELARIAVGRIVSYPSTSTFIFSAKGKVERHDVVVDFGEGLQALFPDCLQLEVVVRHARSTDFFMCGCEGSRKVFPSNKGSMVNPRGASHRDSSATGTSSRRLEDMAEEDARSSTSSTESRYDIRYILS